MTENTQLQKRNGTIEDMIKAQKPGFALVLPKDFDSDRFTRIAITAVKNNPSLQQCDPLSLLGSLMLSAQLGLEPNSPLHEASIIPYAKKAQFQIEYRGLIKLVWNSGMIEYLDYDKICMNDEYEFEKGFEQKFRHVPNLKSDRGDAIAYYAIASLKGGGKAMTIMSKSEIEAHAKRFSKTWNPRLGKFAKENKWEKDKLDESPWETDFDAMAIKTVLKQLADKKLPKRTTDEALKFQMAIGSDGSIVKIKSEQLNANNKIDLGELESIPSENEIENGEYEEIVNEAEPKIKEAEKVIGNAMLNSAKPKTNANPKGKSSETERIEAMKIQNEIIDKELHEPALKLQNINSSTVPFTDDFGGEN